MADLSEGALTLLERMDPGRGYNSPELRQLAPDLNLEALRDVMHELWIAHEVERFGDIGWRRRDDRAAKNAGRAPAADDATPVRGTPVKPEDLFDHEAFAGWFK